MPGPISINGLFWGPKIGRVSRLLIGSEPGESRAILAESKSPTFECLTNGNKKLEESLPLRDRKTTPPSFKGGPACRLSIVGFWGGARFF